VLPVSVVSAFAFFSGPAARRDFVVIGFCAVRSRSDFLLGGFSAAGLAGELACSPDADFFSSPPPADVSEAASPLLSTDAVGCFPAGDAGAASPPGTLGAAGSAVAAGFPSRADTGVVVGTAELTADSVLTAAVVAAPPSDGICPNRAAATRNPKANITAPSATNSHLRALRALRLPKLLIASFSSA
jgi:hypothetical protein